MDNQEGTTRSRVGNRPCNFQPVLRFLCRCSIAFFHPTGGKICVSKSWQPPLWSWHLVCLEGSGHENFSYRFAQVKPTPGTFKVDAQRGFARCSKLIYDTGDLDFRMLPWGGLAPAVHSGLGLKGVSELAKPLTNINRKLAEWTRNGSRFFLLTSCGGDQPMLGHLSNNSSIIEMQICSTRCIANTNHCTNVNASM